MEFKNLFLGLGIVLIFVIALFGFTDALNSDYNSSIGSDTEFNATRSNVQTLLEKNLLNDSYGYARSTQPEAGQETTADESGLISRALNSIGLIDDLLGVVPALIKDGGDALNIPHIYIRIAEALFWIIFTITLAYLLLLGVRNLIPG